MHKTRASGSSQARSVLISIITTMALSLTACSNPSLSLTAEEARDLSDAAKAETYALLHEVLAIAEVDALDAPVQESESAWCSSANYSIESIGSWYLATDVSLRVQSGTAILDRISKHFSRSDRWQVIGDEPGESAGGTIESRSLWSLDPTNDLEVVVDYDPPTQIMHIEAHSDCFLTQAAP